MGTATLSAGVAVEQPPGVANFNRNSHGLQAPVRYLGGSARLRELLCLSNDVPIEELCEQAASIIEGTTIAHEVEPESVEPPKRGRGRPPGSRNRTSDDL